MNFIADLHIHSRYSLATSRQLDIPHLELWGRKKGISVVGTGDAAHPGWLDELKKHLQSCGNGLYRTRKRFLLPETAQYSGEPVQFLPTAEISCIYKRDGRVRKVHNLVMASSFGSFDRIQKRLGAIGNISSDGRPILGIDSRDLLEIVLTADPDACLIPAHIWTPWFSVLGSKSGFDSIGECYGDLSDHIFAVETGLSSDPPMNRRCSMLDRYTLISNSDAHSPEKLGREANRFSTECSFDGIVRALRQPEGTFAGTIEYFPEEGKYHLDGHRACGVCWQPGETAEHGGICPVCGKAVTVGVCNRVNQLADRSDPAASPAPLRYQSLTGLKSVIAECLSMREQSKKVSFCYDDMLRRFGAEFSILTDIPFEELKGYDERIAEGISRLRRGNVALSGGYDGVFGKVSVYG